MSDTVCASGVELLMDYLEGVLPPATVTSIDQHVMSCDRCQAFIASYRATPTVLRDATNFAPPTDLVDNLVAWLKRQPSDN
jgi:hypothetical protein